MDMVNMVVMITDFPVVMNISRCKQNLSLNLHI